MFGKKKYCLSKWIQRYFSPERTALVRCGRLRSQSTRMQKSTDVDRKLTDRGHKGCYSETSNLTQQRLLSLKNCRVNTGLIPQNSHWLGSGKGGSMWSSGWLGIDCAHLLAGVRRPSLIDMGIISPEFPSIWTTFYPFPSSSGRA